MNAVSVYATCGHHFLSNRPLTNLFVTIFGSRSKGLASTILASLLVHAMFPLMLRQDHLSVTQLIDGRIDEVLCLCQSSVRTRPRLIVDSLVDGPFTLAPRPQHLAERAFTSVALFLLASSALQALASAAAKIAPGSWLR